MSKEFIESKHNINFVEDASIQEEQLTYFLESSLEKNSITNKYIEEWASRQYQSNDYFLNWIKSIFKTDVFLKFFKYLRYPIPSAKLVKNKIEPQLKRVFISEDADFKYDVTGKDLSEIKGDLNIKQFEKELFYHLLYKHNSLIVADVKDEKAFRYFLDIRHVVAIEGEEPIKRIAYTAVVDGQRGVLYVDSNEYIFYNEKHEQIGEPIPNELGYVPIHYINPNKYKNEPVVKESLFTFLREEFEEYVFLKTLQRMTEPSGAIPVATTVETEKDDKKDIDSQTEPTANNIMSSQRAGESSTNAPKGMGLTDPGTVHELPLEAIQTDTGIDATLLEKFINFTFIPVDILTYINERITEIENSITTTAVGNVDIAEEQAQNQAQIERSLNSLQNRLVSVAELLNRARRLSDKDMLSLNYSVEAVNEVFIFYGTDFFLDSLTKLYTDLEKAPNPVERKNILIRINQNKYKSNQDQLIRQIILYDLLPYITDSDFEIARDAQQVSDINFEYQNRFNYWIQLFEAKYGDIVTFWKSLDFDNFQKLILINNLIIELIKKENENNPGFNKPSVESQG